MMLPSKNGAPSMGLRNCSCKGALPSQQGHFSTYCSSTRDRSCTRSGSNASVGLLTSSSVSRFNKMGAPRVCPLTTKAAVREP